MSHGEATFRNPGLRVGRLGGLDVWLHWSLIILLALQLLNSVARLKPEQSPMLSWIVASLVLIASLLVHELSHLRVASVLGGVMDRVVLWPLGGLSRWDAQADHRARAIVALAGPVASGVLAFLAATTCLACGWSFLPDRVGEPGFHVARILVQSAFLWNSLILLLNLIPCVPMDGGFVFQAWVVAKGRATDGASSPAPRVGNVAAVLAAVVSLGLFFVTILDREFPIAHPFLDAMWWGLFLVAVSYFLEAKAHRERGGDRETEDGVFGYDFSFGYTSLERTATRGERGTALSRLKEKFGRRGPKAEPPSREEIENRLDELLQKIHEKGMDSLTRSERSFLKKASRHYRS